MHVVYSIIHNSSGNILSSDSLGPRSLYIQVQLFLSSILSSVFLRVQTVQKVLNLQNAQITRKVFGITFLLIVGNFQRKYAIYTVANSPLNVCSNTYILLFLLSCNISCF